MALRETKTLSKKPDAEEPAQELFHQRKMPDTSQFRLQVDRQTKSSHTDCATAVAAGLVIKTKYPILHVSVYDAVTGENTVIEAPAA
jgi:hypothetical protein